MTVLARYSAWGNVFYCRLAYRIVVTFTVLSATLIVSDQCKAQDGVLIKESCSFCSVRTISLAGYGGEENWSSIRMTENGDVLIGQSSRTASAKLLLVDPDTGNIRCIGDLEKAGNLAPLERQPKIHVTPVRDKAGCYHFLSHCGLDTHLPLHGSRIGYEGMRRWKWNPMTDKIEQLGRVLDAEGAIALNSSLDGSKLFVVSFPQALLLEIDSISGKTRNFGRTNAVYAPRHIVVDPWDNPYVLDHEGRFWMAGGEQEELRPLDVKLPVGKEVSGNVLAQGVVALAELDGRSVYLMMSAWGQLYEIKFTGPGRLTVSSKGNPADGVDNPKWHPPGKRQLTAAGLAIGPDGYVYVAISGYNRGVDQSGDSYIIRCNRMGTRADIVARLDGTRISYICGNNVVDYKSQRIYFAGNHLINDSPYLIFLSNFESLQEK